MTSRQNDKIWREPYDNNDDNINNNIKRNNTNNDHSNNDDNNNNNNGMTSRTKLRKSVHVVCIHAHD